jgi:perosamine synthetase
LPVGEGGAVTTADDDLAERVQVTRQHGMSRDAWRRYGPGNSWRYAVDHEGLKANFTDLQAAIAIGQLTHLSHWQARRVELAARYDAQLRDVPGIVLPPRPAPGEGIHAWHLYVVRVRPPYRLTRDELIDQLAERGIGTSVHFVPVHRFGRFQRLLGNVSAVMPNAERLADELLSLPMHPQLTEDDVDYVCAQLVALQKGGRIADVFDGSARQPAFQSPHGARTGRPHADHRRW